MALQEFLRSSTHSIALINFSFGGDKVHWITGRIEGVTKDDLDLIIKTESWSGNILYIHLHKITQVTILAPRNPDDPKYTFPSP